MVAVSTLRHVFGGRIQIVAGMVVPYRRRQALENVLAIL
jgi:hypothetical protein